MDDYFVFAVEQTERLDALEGATVRYRVRAELAGRLFDAVSIDVGFGDARIAAPDALRGPDLLGFAGLPPIEVPALSLPVHIAEKVHAYTRLYGDGMRPNTRVKDMVDLALIAGTVALDAHPVGHALDAMFTARSTHPLPAALPPPPADWARPYAKLAGEIGIDPTIAAGYSLAAAFLDPLLSGAIATESRWNPATRAWMDVEEGT